VGTAVRGDKGEMGIEPLPLAGLGVLGGGDPAGVMEH
jgi:hypothetical protein